MKTIAVHAPRVTYYCGGAERYVLNLLVELSKRNSCISLVSYDAPKKSEWFRKFIKNFNGTVCLLKSSKMRSKFDKFSKAFSPSLWDEESKIFGEETKKFYRKNSFDLVVCHYAVDCLYLPKKTKICLHLHGLPDKRRKIENKAIKIPNKIIAVSNYVGEGWKRLYKLKKKIYIVPNGISLEKKSFGKGNIDIIFFGRLINVNGVNILLKSLRILNNQNIYPRTTIVGGGPEERNLINLAKKMKIKNINFLGRVKDKKLFNCISSSKISVFPSYKREGIMTTLLEASKYGSLIVASDSCSNKEFIKDNFNGILFKPKDYKDMSVKLKAVLSDKGLRSKLIKNSFETLKNFTWKKQAKKIERIYY